MKLSLFTASSLALLAEVSCTILGRVQHIEQNGKFSCPSQLVTANILQQLLSDAVVIQDMVQQPQLLKSTPSRLIVLHPPARLPLQAS